MLVSPYIAVVGATASGKSSLALDLAERLGGEIINTDAMQVYRGMDIGTAKLPHQQRRNIIHHLLDTLDVDEPASVAEFQGWAREIMGSLRARNRPAVLVGGSALYTRAVLDQFDFPGTDPDVRARFESELDDLGSATLHERLAREDPAAAERILPDNGRRIVRALEVIEITGEPFSARLPKQEYAFEQSFQIGIDIDRPALDVRIARRVEEMFDQGLVEEVARLSERGLLESRTASRAIGYREAAAYLAGELSLDEAKERTATATRRFSRRQDSWFRNDPRVHWLPYDSPDLLEQALAVVAE